jgi:hypothetical protein
MDSKAISEVLKRYPDRIFRMTFKCLKRMNLEDTIKAIAIMSLIN